MKDRCDGFRKYLHFPKPLPPSVYCQKTGSRGRGKTGPMWCRAFGLGGKGRGNSSERPCKHYTLCFPNQCPFNQFSSIPFSVYRRWPSQIDEPFCFRDLGFIPHVYVDLFLFSGSLFPEILVFGYKRKSLLTSLSLGSTLVVDLLVLKNMKFAGRCSVPHSCFENKQIAPVPSHIIEREVSWCSLHPFFL